MPKNLADYLALDYPLRLTPDPSGGYVFEYPDLPGCIGQVDSLDELADATLDARTLWLTVALERGREIHEPSDDYSGKFLVRIGRSLHRQLALLAESDGMSLNQYVVRLLSERQMAFRVDRRLDQICFKIDNMHADLRRPDFSGLPQPSIEFAEDGVDVPLAA